MVIFYNFLRKNIISCVKKYTEDLKKQVRQFRRSRMSFGDIATSCDVSKSVVQYIIQTDGRMKKKAGRKQILNKHDKRNIKTELDNSFKANKKCSVNDLAKTLNLKASKSTVWRCLKDISYNYKNIPRKFQLTPNMRQKRVNMAKQFLIDRVDWQNVCFSDEKHFTLNGIDAYYCWTYKGSSPRRIKNVIRSSGLTVWAMILPNGLLSYEIVRGNMNSCKYIEIIKKAVKILNLTFPGQFIFQQDNCPFHVSKFSKNYFLENEIKLLDWPPYSPDLNVIENIWSVLSTSVYSGSQIKNLNELEHRIEIGIQLFNETQKIISDNLYKSIPSRLISVITKRGERLKY